MSVYYRDKNGDDNLISGMAPITNNITDGDMAAITSNAVADALQNKANNTVISPSSTAEATTTATKTHTAGDYFELNGEFVKAKTNIAIGDTLTENTNYEVTTIADELAPLTAVLSNDLSNKGF